MVSWYLAFCVRNRWEPRQEVWSILLLLNLAMRLPECFMATFRLLWTTGLWLKVTVLASVTVLLTMKLMKKSREWQRRPRWFWQPIYSHIVVNAKSKTLLKVQISLVVSIKLNKFLLLLQFHSKMWLKSLRKLTMMNLSQRLVTHCDRLLRTKWIAS